MYTGVRNTGYIIYITINIYLFIFIQIICIFSPALDDSYWAISKSRNICIFACPASLLKRSKVILNAVFDFNYEAFYDPCSHT
jgi:hypothetical protein